MPQLKNSKMKHFILITLLLATTSSYNLTAQKISSEDYKKNYIHEECKILRELKKKINKR